jgi:hypothetical protein
MNDATFCFLVTQDLTKEHIWREWFAGLERLQFRFAIVVHCSLSNNGNVKSDWLRQRFIPDDSMRPTGWGWVVDAMMSMYDHALQTHPSEWYTLHSESCVPMVSPERFVEIFNKYKQKSFISYDKIWWDPKIVNRANLHMLPPHMHLAHSQWCIFCHEDLSQMVNLSKTNEKIKHMLSTIMRGHAGEESYAAVLLLNINMLKNVMNKKTTLVDWKRTPNGNNPYKFEAWTFDDAKSVWENRKTNPNEYMFMRKVGPAFPDDVLRKHIFDNNSKRPLH